jgi:hypothetical protein
MPVLGDDCRIRVNLETAVKREPLLECAAQRKSAEGGQVRVVDHRIVCAVQKTGDRDAYA